MILDLSSLALSSAGAHLGTRPDAWLRASLDLAGIQHFVDLVAVLVDRTGVQRAAPRELDAMVRLHHLAYGADGPFATVTVRGQPFVLFVTPSSQ